MKKNNRIMHTTVCSTPIITPILRLLAIVILKLVGWKTVGRNEAVERCVLIGAPHTSNWDFPLMLLAVLELRLQIYWMGKNSLFPFPVGWLMRWLGGIPIDRSKSNNMVEHTVKQYQENQKLVVLIPPEGTRAQVKRWKTGFYHIANNAGVPILLGFIDASKKEVGLADFFHPTGDLERDMEQIRAFYANKRGIRPENS